MFDSLVVVIPVRKNFKSAEKVVDEELLSLESLVLRKIRQLRSFLPKKQVVVCTENKEFSELAIYGGATVLMRDVGLSRADAKISNLVKFVAQSIQSEHIAWVPYITPFFDTNDYIKSFETYFYNINISNKYDSLVSVVKEKKFLWTVNGPINYAADKNQPPSDDLPIMYSVCNGNYMAPRTIMLDRKYYLGEKVYLDIKPEYCGIDINSLKTFHEANGYQSIVRQLM